MLNLSHVLLSVIFAKEAMGHWIGPPDASMCPNAGSGAGLLSAVFLINIQIKDLLPKLPYKT